MISTRKIISAMWAMGRPSEGAEFANIYRAAVKAGLNGAQAMCLTCQAYDASKGYEWKLEDFSLRYATQLVQAALYPNGKCAEELAAIREGRPSRWGTPAFHSDHGTPAVEGA